MRRDVSTRRPSQRKKLVIRNLQFEFPTSTSGGFRVGRRQNFDSLRRSFVLFGVLFGAFRLAARAVRGPSSTRFGASRLGAIAR